MDLIVLIIILWAAASAVEDVKKHLRTSRRARIAEREERIAPKALSKTQRRATAARHDTGWWWREATHGFPVARYGWRTGWVAHQAAHEQQKAIHAQHKGVLESFRATRQQGQANAAVTEAGPGQMSRQEMKQKLQAASPPAQSQGQQVPVPPAAPAPMPAAAGAPVEPAAAVPPVLASLQEPATEPAQPPAAPPATTNGVPMSSGTTEYTYQQTVDEAARTAALAESLQAEIARCGIPQMVDSLSVSGLDRGSLGRLDDVHTAYERVAAGAQSLMDNAASFRDSLIRDHGSVNEAHQAAPEGGAEKPFYVGS